MACLECGKPTAKDMSIRCQKCNNIYRKGKPVIKKKKDSSAWRKCPVCSNLQHVNFTQSKILDLKVSAHTATVLRNAVYAQLKTIRTEHKRQQKKLDVLRKFREKLERECQKRIKEMQDTNKAVTRRIKNL